MNTEAFNERAELAEAAPCGIIQFREAGGAILRANRYSCDELGYTTEEILNLKFEQILTVSSRIFHQTHFLPLLKLHGHAEEIFLTLRHKSEAAVPMLTNAVLRKGSPSTIVCAFFAVHQRGKYEEEILAAKRKSEEALNSNAELVASRAELQQRLQELDANRAALERRNHELLRLGEIFSHDLREPARKIAAFTNILREENFETLSDNGKLSIQRIDAACARINQLLRTLQQFIWIDSDSEALVPVNLHDIIRSASSTVGGDFEIEVDELPVIPGLPGQLRVLFEFLLHSSLARSIERPIIIRIRGCQVQHNSFRNTPGKYSYRDYLQLMVEDDGKPFGCEDCNHLFQLLHKHPSQLSHPDLAICRKIVENHSGFILLRSPAAGGAVFTIYLPMTKSTTIGNEDPENSFCGG